jgi:hypothetical protein
MSIKEFAQDIKLCLMNFHLEMENIFKCTLKTKVFALRLFCNKFKILMTFLPPKCTLKFLIRKK